MNTYEFFAYYYDSLMEGEFYKDYIQFLTPKINAKTILELGCGTGTMALALSDLSNKIIATDISEEMLEVAKSKAKNQHTNVVFEMMDMRDIKLHSSFDTILCLCDSLNYLDSLDDIKQTFSSVYQHLHSDGYFVFDVHSLYKINHIFNDYKEEYEDDNEYFYWHVKKIEEGAIQHIIIIEDKLEDIRIEEKHIQRTYDISIYQQLLHTIGFQDIKIYGEFEEITPTSERIIMIARKY